jgi:hypothetical protein
MSDEHVRASFWNVLTRDSVERRIPTRKAEERLTLEQKVKGEMWCPTCNAPRTGCGRRSSDPMPAVELSLLSFGGAPEAAKREKYVCATCGTLLVRK